MKLCLITILLYLQSGNAQRAFLGFPTEAQQQICRELTNVTADQVQQWEAESVDCVDRFEEVEAAACFHACILQQYGMDNADYEPIIETITEHIFYIDAIQIEKITIDCYNSYEGDSKCFRAYHVHKCTDKSIGRYPRGAKHIPIDLVPDDIAEKCRSQLKMTEAEVCRYEHATDYDQVEANRKPRCYYACILTEMGYVQNRVNPNISTYRTRYSYIEDMRFLLTFFECYFDLPRWAAPCDATYHMYKCMKLKFGEFPPQTLPPPTSD